MELSEKHRQILNFLADERDNNPPGFVDIRALEAKISVYLRVEVDILIRQLQLEGLVKRYSNKVIITEKGYRLVRRWYRKALSRIRAIYVATVEGTTRALTRH